MQNWLEITNNKSKKDFFMWVSKTAANFVKINRTSDFGFLTVSKSLIWKFSYEKEFFSIIYRSQRKIEKDKNMTFLAWSRMRFSKIYTLHRISENRKSVSTARESRVHFFHEPFFCEHEWDSQKNKIFVHLHKQSVKSKFACALFPHPCLWH